MKYLPLIFTMCLMQSGCQALAVNPSEQIDEAMTSYSSQKHRAAAVFYRWLYFYESTEPNVNEQISLLSDKIEITTPTGQVKGIASYLKVIESAYWLKWKNAHHVQSISITERNAHDLIIDAQVIYQTLKQGSVVDSVLLNYVIKVNDRGGTLSQIESISVTVVETIRNKLFTEAFVKNFSHASFHETQAKQKNRSNTLISNKISAFVYYWYSIFDERPAFHNLEKLVTDILDITITKNFKTKQEFLKWYESMRVVPMSNLHDIQWINIQPSDKPGYFTADVYLAWTSIQNGKSLTKQMKNRMILRQEDGTIRLESYFPQIL